MFNFLKNDTHPHGTGSLMEQLSSLLSRARKQKTGVEILGNHGNRPTRAGVAEMGTGSWDFISILQYWGYACSRNLA